MNLKILFLSATQSERTPLIRSYVQGLNFPTTNTESIGNFYSPLQSPEGSIYGSDDPRLEHAVSLTKEEVSPFLYSHFKV